jgi:hypothetical protein
VGIEATVNAQWFEKDSGEHHHELWVGDAAAIAPYILRSVMFRQRVRLAVCTIAQTAILKKEYSYFIA